MKMFATSRFAGDRWIPNLREVRTQIGWNHILLKVRNSRWPWNLREFTQFDRSGSNPIVEESRNPKNKNQNVRNPAEPEIQNSRYLEIQNPPENSETQTSRIAKTRKSTKPRNPETRKLQNPLLQKSQKPTNPDIQESRNPQTHKSRIVEVQRSTNPRIQNAKIPNPETHESIKFARKLAATRINLKFALRGAIPDLNYFISFSHIATKTLIISN